MKKKKSNGRKSIKRRIISAVRKSQRFVLRLVSLVLMVIIPVGVIFGIGYYSEMDTILTGGGSGNQVEKRETAETDTSGFTYYETPEENIVTDAGITYAGNEILVVLNSEKDKEKLDEYLAAINSSVVGSIDELAEYQVLLDRNYSYTEIKDLADELETYEWVTYASPNYMMKTNTSYTPNDSKWKYKWGNLPEGNNWGMEAINAPGAWDYKDEMSYVNIGIIDDMFTKNHEDLKFAEKPLYNEKALSNKKIKWSDHGTHVAGTIAATCDNRKGVSGVSMYTNLYGVASRGWETTGYEDVQAQNLALYYLIVKKKCSVVNISMAYDQISFEASRGVPAMEKYLEEIAGETEKFLKLLIDMKYSFVICKAAGNQNKVTKNDIDYLYFRMDSDDPENSSDGYAYLSYADYLDYCDGDTEGKEYFERYKDRKAEIEERLEGGNVDTKYDFMGAIKNEEVKNRIIMVGAVQNSGTERAGGIAGFFGKKEHKGFQIADFSQCGETVNVIAPGVDIYSTVKDGYAELSGTSMASPHVAGIAGLIFSVKPDIDADTVKKIIVDSAEGSYGDEGYGLVNAKNAVEMALGHTSEKSKEKTSDREEKEATEAETDVYVAYQNAVKHLTDAGSWSESLSAVVDMNLVSADKRQKTRAKIYLDYGGNIRDYDPDNLSALKVSASANIQVGGQETAFTADYENGTVHYQYTQPTSYSADAKLDPVYFQFSQLTPDMMQNVSMAGNVISFTVSGDQMTALGSEMINMIDGAEDLKYEDCDVDIILNEESGQIDRLKMKFNASMIYQGYTTDAVYDVDYQFAS